MEEATNELQLALTATSSDLDDALRAQFFGTQKTEGRKRTAGPLWHFKANFKVLDVFFCWDIKR